MYVCSERYVSFFSSSSFLSLLENYPRLKFICLYCKTTGFLHLKGNGKLLRLAFLPFILLRVFLLMKHVTRATFSTSKAAPTKVISTITKPGIRPVLWVVPGWLGPLIEDLPRKSLKDRTRKTVIRYSTYTTTAIMYCNCSYMLVL